MKKVGITTTVPLEPFFASGTIPVDLNNSFMDSDDPAGLVEEAQVRGFPRNICTWIKGLYGSSHDLEGVVGVVRGDCSNTESLLETLSSEGIETHPFSYPPDRSRRALLAEVESLCDFLGCDLESCERVAPEIEELRDLARKVDEIRWKYLSVSAQEAHVVQLSTSDFDSDPVSWKKRVEGVLKKGREIHEGEGIRLGYIGVPPIITDIFPSVEDMGGEVVFFETQRQFTMPFREDDWINRYLSYTYPYDIAGRVKDIQKEIKVRNIQGIIHYVQSFCHRQIDDILFRKEIDVPILTIEGNLPGPLDGRTRLRLESFIDVLEGID
mgnify:CR=1 FL=1